MQLTSDEHRAYLEAIEGAFGNAIDYAMLARVYDGAATAILFAPQRIGIASKAIPTISM